MVGTGEKAEEKLFTTLEKLRKRIGEL